MLVPAASSGLSGTGGGYRTSNARFDRQVRSSGNKAPGLYGLEPVLLHYLADLVRASFYSLFFQFDHDSPDPITSAMLLKGLYDSCLYLILHWTDSR